MSELITHTAKLVPYAKRPKQLASFVTAYTYEPEPNEATLRLGNLYVVIEVLISGRASEEVADLVIESIGDQYYNNPIEGDPLSHFEAAIKATNHQLAEFVNQGNAAWIGKMSAVVAVIAGEEIHLAQTGSADSYLYRNKTTTRITTPAARPAVPSKTFGSIASGGLEPGDRLLITTPALVHQIALNRLHSIVAGHTPNAAIAELTSHLPATGSERIAALVIEISTPELSALRVRSEQPSEIRLGQPETALDAAKFAAEPLRQTAIASSRRVGSAAKVGAERARPVIKQTGLWLVSRIRDFLSAPKAARRIVIALAVVLIVIVFFVIRGNSNKHLGTLRERYDQDYQSFLAAEHNQQLGDTASAASQLTALGSELAKLAAANGHGALDKSLAKANLAAGEPHSIAVFSGLVSSTLDSLEGLTKATATTVVAYGKLHPNRIVVLSGKSYLINSGNNPTISIVDNTTKSIKTSTADTSNLGTVVATAISSASDGFYLLTSAPKVWFYSTAANSLTLETISQDAWEPGTAIASYNTNLYVLSNGVIYRHTRTLSGFTPGSEVVGADSSGELANAAGLAIDGSIYTNTPKGFEQYLAGSLKSTVALPTHLAKASDLTAYDSFVLATSVNDRRIGIITTSGTAPAYAKQFEINGTSQLTGATYDPAAKLIYALVNDRLVSFTPNL